MIAHDRLPLPIDRFLREARQILWRAKQAVVVTEPPMPRAAERNAEEGDDDNDDDDKTVNWALEFSPPVFSLETNIKTIAGLERVLEQLRVNVPPPRPPMLKSTESISSEEYQMPSFLHSIATVLCLSSLFPLPRMDVSRQFNTFQVMRHCVHAFVVCDGALFIDAARLLADTDMVLSHPAPTRQFPVQTLLILSICTLMIRHVMLHKQGHPGIAAGLMHTYYTHAKLLLQDLFDFYHVYVVQSLFILSLYPHGHMDMFSPARTHSSLLKIALRTAFAMDLHKLDAAEKVESSDRERLRRLAWMLLCADYYADWNTSGGTGVINVTEWQVDFPRPLPGEQMARRVEYLSQHCRIVMIRKMHLFRTAYSIVIQSPKALKDAMDRTLFETYMNTPEHFRVQLGDGMKRTWSRADLEPLLLHASYCDTRIAAYVPFLSGRYLYTLDQEKAARETLVKDIYERVVQNSMPQTAIADFLSYRQPVQPGKTMTPETEFYCVVGCLSAANEYTYVLELLAEVDPIGCYHSPVYGCLVTSYVFHMLEVNSRDREVVVACRINLVRILRIIQRARSIFPDATILYLEQVLPRWIRAAAPNEPSYQLRQQVTSLVEGLKERAKNWIMHVQQQPSRDGSSRSTVKAECI